MIDTRPGLMRSSAAAAVFALLAACAPHRAPEIGSNNVRVTYIVSFENSHVPAPQFQQRFEAAFAESGAPMVGLQMNAISSGRAASRPLSTESYRAALDDAHAKAQLLAQHAHVTLGALRSVTEQGADAGFGAPSGASALRLKGNTPTVRGPASGVSLNVVYDISGGGERAIAVLGFGDERPALPTDSGPARALNVSLNGHAAALADAQHAVAKDEALLVQTAAALDPNIRVTKSESSLDVYR